MSAISDPSDLSDRELILTRVFDAPPEKVFRAWTEPAWLMQWFAPLPWTTPRADLDVRPGGSNTIFMRNPEGEEWLFGKCRYTRQIWWRLCKNPPF